MTNTRADFNRLRTLLLAYRLLVRIAFEATGKHNRALAVSPSAPMGSMELIV